MHLARTIEVIVLAAYPVAPCESIAVRAKVIPLSPHSNPTVFSICPIGVFILVAFAGLDQAAFTLDYSLVDRLDNTLGIGLAKFFKICLAAHVHGIARIGDKGMLDDYSRNAPFASTIYHRVVVCNAAVRVLRTVFRIARLHTSIGEPQSSQLRNNLLPKRLASYMSVMIVATIVGNPHLTAFRCRRCDGINVQRNKDSCTGPRRYLHAFRQAHSNITRSRHNDGHSSALECGLAVFCNLEVNVFFS